MLGKRKREIADAVGRFGIAPDGSPSGNDENLQEAFRRHFEAQFQPLTEQKTSVLSKPAVEVGLEADADESDWEGISNDDENVNAEVVEYTTPEGLKRVEVPKEGLKEFMVLSPL